MEDEKNDYNPEEEVTTGNWNTPKIELKEVEIKTGEEDESLFWSGRSKLYRWVEGEWKERGLGESKLLLHKKNGTIRFLLRQEKTLKVVANHYIYPNESYCKLVPNAGSEKIYAWTVKDFAEEPKIEQFALKFNTAEAAKLFKQKFDEAGKINLKLLDDKCELKTEKVEDKEKKDEKKDEKKEEKKEEKKDEKKDEKDDKKDKEDKDKKEDKDEKDEKDKKDDKEDKDDKDKKDDKDDKDKKDEKDDKDKKDEKDDEDKKDEKDNEDKKEDKDKDKKDEEENIKRED
ncbi:ran-specific GTPase-activating protein 1, putative [Plasmodium chabaudi chabaudi]|uniref:Ran-specific GTPase-activating protein 1, putative n=1 Tax=Plasmodium chabaudi chabaudi TaxID=31271 RepID=A0A4V6Z8K5_PLACU|nr:ran-specific GTPase-activating protein 1, putative [Plasmodium chabaudi chabaudi]VTZ68177.1 ran-specific GTPase-activating protein 1, putative [Plasmodium chabaudi chabaudi]|eukprot:XP_016653688.1 ran binding protein 1, putative [Plasmodium chabaudi chabaudi]